MTNDKKIEILSYATTYFIEIILPKCKEAIKKCGNPKAYAKMNPFFPGLLAQIFWGSANDYDLSKTMICLGLSHSLGTIYGNQIQYFIQDAFQVPGTRLEGFDLTFTDAIDGRKKYCQIKAGPNTLGPASPKAIVDAFHKFIRVGNTNQARPIPNSDIIVGVTFGTHKEISSHYKKIEKHGFPVYTGQEFWRRLSGDEDFYFDLQCAFKNVASTTNMEDIKELLELTIKEITQGQRTAKQSKRNRRGQRKK